MVDYPSTTGQEVQPSPLPGGAAGEAEDTTLAQAKLEPIDRLKPLSEQHTKVLGYLLDRISYSERQMGTFYSRWRVNEKKLQAYIDLPKYEQILKEMTSKGEPPNITSITIPYSFATVWTVVTYLVHAFCGRKPMFQVASHQAEMSEAALKMETVLQYNADHVRLIRALFQFFLDGESYGVGILRNLWKDQYANRTVWRQGSPGGLLMPGMPPEQMQVRERKMVFQGTDVRAIDPFMFFPDPRVPMSEVNRRGEFVFWRSFEGEQGLVRAEADGLLKWVKAAPKQVNNAQEGVSQSIRNIVAGGDGHAGAFTRQDTKALPFYQVDQGTVDIIPADLGLMDPEEPGAQEPAKWIFTILNKGQIVQAEPLDLDHDLHPVAVIEPYTFGYGFGQMGLLDMLGPLQDSASWFLNSHVHNVRAVLNNMLVVDPSMIEMQDLKTPGPGKTIRLKRTAYGQDVRTAVHQLQVGDITRGHVSDMREFMRLGDALASVNDNLKGVEQSGGRKTATEVRYTGESGVSRLASHARLISAQGMVDLTEQMCLNLQQNLSMEFYLQVVGQDGLRTPMRIGPQQLVGDFYYPIHDGILPIDRVAMLDIWKEILFGVARDPLLRQTYDITRMFSYIAELGGAPLSQFEIKMAPDQKIEAALRAGNAVGGEALPGAGMPQGI